MVMKHLLFFLLVGTIISTYTADGWLFDKAKKYAKDFAGGAKDMWRNYNDMKKANTKGADKYFHAKGNYEAAKRGTGGKHAAAIISNAREAIQLAKGVIERKPIKDLVSDMRADQRANKWGRSGGDPNKYRPKGLDKKYKK